MNSTSDCKIYELIERLTPKGQQVKAFEIEAAEYVESFLQQLGFVTQRQAVKSVRVDGQAYPYFNLLAEKGSGTHALLLFAHLDLPPTSWDWFSEDTAFFYLDHRLYSPGISGMKGGLLALLHALASVDVLDDFKLKLAFLVDGEGLQSGTQHLIQSNWLEDVALAICPHPIYSDKSSSQLNTFMVWENGQNVQRPSVTAIQMIADYVQDYLNSGAIEYASDKPLFEASMLAGYQSQQRSPFPVLAFGPTGHKSDDEGEWVELDSLMRMSRILRFIIQDYANEGFKDGIS